MQDIAFGNDADRMPGAVHDHDGRKAPLRHDLRSFANGRIGSEAGHVARGDIDQLMLRIHHALLTRRFVFVQDRGRNVALPPYWHESFRTAPFSRMEYLSLWSGL